MAAHSVNDFSSLINTQIDYHEKIQEYLLKAEALAHVALSKDFLGFGQSILYEYLGIMFDVIVESRQINQAALDRLMICGRQSGLSS
jgi:hypothetical protein